MALIRSLKQKKGDYSEAFLIANETRSVVRIQPTPLEYWISTSDAKDNYLIEIAKKKWPEKSLKEVIEVLSQNFPLGSQGTTNLDQVKL